MTHHFSLFAFNDWMRAYRQAQEEGRAVSLLTTDYKLHSIQH